MKPDISVILTCYNFRDFLRTAVLSLLNQQTDRLLELIVIDDASPDKSPEVIADLSDPRLRLIVNERNIGFAASANLGFESARGAYVARFDGDDEWRPDALAKLATALDLTPEATVAYGDMRTISATGELGSGGVDRPAGPAVRREFEQLLQRHYTCAPAMLSRRSAWEGLLPWPDRFRSGLGDWYFNLKLAQLGPFVWVDSVIAHYRIHPNGMHYQFVRDGSGEIILRSILDELLPQANPALLPQPAALIYAQHLRGMADAYYQFGMDPQARRIYRELLWRRPGVLLARNSLFPALASLTIGRSRYERWKQKLRPRPPPAVGS